MLGMQIWRLEGPWLRLVHLWERERDVESWGDGFWRMKMTELRLVLIELTLVNRAEKLMVWNHLVCGGELEAWSWEGSQG